VAVLLAGVLDVHAVDQHAGMLVVDVVLHAAAMHIPSSPPGLLGQT
jgi:hypothetical protein